MLVHIMLKEIRDNFLNSRFLGASALSLLIIVASIAILARSHEEEFRDYQGRVRTQEEFIDRFAHVNRISWMSLRHREPPPLQALAGSRRWLGTHAQRAKAGRDIGDQPLAHLAVTARGERRQQGSGEEAKPPVDVLRGALG